jgi:Ca2+/H+ antiporter
LLEPSLVNRLLGVAVAVFAIPVLLEARALVAGADAPGSSVLGGALLAAGLLAAGFAGLLRGAPRAVELRAGRALCAVLAAEVAALAATLLSRVV